MEDKVIRSYVEKKKGFDVEAQKLYREFREILNIKSLTGVRLINRYDISGINKKEYMASRSTIFSEPTVDEVYDEQFEFNEGDRIFVMEYLPGQYDQRADSAVQCIQILTQSEKPLVQTAKVIVLEGDITEAEFSRVKNYCINPVDSREARQDKPISLDMSVEIPADVEIVKDFILKSTEELKEYRGIMGFAMSLEDIKFCQAYFRDIEKRNPSITEIKVIDTYWSDHCRHTTFLTEIKEVCFENTPQSKTIKKAYKQYIDARKYVYQEQNRDMCLMDMAVMGMKVLRKGSVDVSIVNLPLIWDHIGFEMQVLKEIQDVFIAGKAYCELENKQVSFRELEAYPVLLLEKNSTTRDYFDELMARYQVSILPEFELGSMDLLVELSKIGLGISFVTEDAITSAIASKEIFKLNTLEAIPKRRIGVLTKKGIVAPVAAQKFIEICISATHLS